MNYAEYMMHDDCAVLLDELCLCRRDGHVLLKVSSQQRRQIRLKQYDVRTVRHDSYYKLAVSRLYKSFIMQQLLGAA